jgi:hypothetical protein
MVSKALIEAEASKIEISELEEALANALTHASTEVRDYAAEGIGHFLSANELSVLERCVGAIALEARLTDEVLIDERSRPYDERQPLEEAYLGISPRVRQVLNAEAVEFEKEIGQLNLDDWPGRRAAKWIMQIFAYTLEHPFSLDFHLRISEYLVSAWEKNRSDQNERRDYEFELACREHLAQFVLRIDQDTAFRICRPLIDAADKYPENVSEFVQSLVTAEDRSPDQTTFWPLWQSFADQACSAEWVDRLDSDRYMGRKLIDQLFLSGPWKQEIRHWSRLNGHAHRIDGLVERLPPSSFVIGAYARFLYDIGEKSLPGAYRIIASRLTGDMVLDSNCIYCLEHVLSRQVFAEPHKLKSDDRVHQAVISILDHLVDQGSSSAYRMRDDFVTPIS